MKLQVDLTTESQKRGVRNQCPMLSVLVIPKPNAAEESVIAMVQRGITSAHTSIGGVMHLVVERLHTQHAEMEHAAVVKKIPQPRSASE